MVLEALREDRPALFDGYSTVVLIAFGVWVRKNEEGGWGAGVGRFDFLGSGKVLLVPFLSLVGV